MSFTWFTGFLAIAVGTDFGGGIAWLFKVHQKSIVTIYGLCGGLLLGLISFGIVPEVIQLGDWMILLLGFLAGVILFELLHSIFPSVSINESKTNFIRTGVLLTLSISIHNLPIGIMLESSQDTSLSISLLQTMVLHSIQKE